MQWLLTDIISMVNSVKPMFLDYGLQGLFLVLLLESLGILFMPGESLLVAAGFIGEQTGLPLIYIICVSASATIIGWGISYAVGRRFGHGILYKYGKFVLIKASTLDKAHEFFTKYGPLVVVISRFIVPLRQLQGYVAGSSEMSPIRFHAWNVVGALTWVSAWSGAAWYIALHIIHNTS